MSDFAHAVRYKDSDGVWHGLPAIKGEGVPTGGTAGQILKKTSSTDFDTEWGQDSYNNLTDRPAYNGSTITGSTNIPQVKTAAWDAKYDKPSTGIPKTDLASAVQTSLGKADTALQEHQSLSAYRTSAAQDVIDAAQNTTIAAKASTSDLTTHTGNTGNPHNVTAEQTQYNDESSSHTPGSVAETLAWHTNTISSHTSTLSSHTSTLSSHTTALSTHTANIATNAANITTNTSAIAENTDDIETNTANIATNTSDIDALEAALTNKTATSANVGKFAKVKTVTNGKVSEWELAGSDLDYITVNSSGEICVVYET